MIKRYERISMREATDNVLSNIKRYLDYLTDLANDGTYFDVMDDGGSRYQIVRIDGDKNSIIQTYFDPMPSQNEI